MKGFIKDGKGFMIDKKGFRFYMKLETPSNPALISDPLGPVPLVWSGRHPLAKINISQNKGVAEKEGEGPANQAECQETAHMCCHLLT